MDGTTGGTLMGWDGDVLGAAPALALAPATTGGGAAAVTGGSS